jgi:hypothetical protein
MIYPYFIPPDYDWATDPAGIITPSDSRPISDDEKLLIKAQRAALAARHDGVENFSHWVTMSDERMIERAVATAFEVFKKGLVDA